MLPLPKLSSSIRQGLLPFLVFALHLLLSLPSAQALPLVTYITGDTPTDGQLVFRAEFDPAVKDSAILSIAASESTSGLRLDNIDFVPGSGFTEVVVTAQIAATTDGALTRYNVFTGAELTDVIASTNAIAVAPPSGVSRPASIVPNEEGTHYYYNENQFGFDGSSHRMIRVPIDGGAEEVVFDGTASGGTLVEFSGVEILDDRMYFFAHDTSGPAAERQLYSVPLGGGGLASGPAVLEVSGLDRSSATSGAGPGVSDGSDEMDFDFSTGMLYGTNNSTGEIFGFVPGTGPLAVGAVPFYIDPADITAAAAVTTDDGLGLLSGVTTPGAAGPIRQIDGIRPDGDGHLIVIGHNGVMVSIDIGGVLGDGADDLDIIRLFNKDVLTAGLALGFDRTDVMFDDHTILAPNNLAIPEPSTFLLSLVGFGCFLRRSRRLSKR